MYLLLAPLCSSLLSNNASGAFFSRDPPAAVAGVGAIYRSAKIRGRIALTFNEQKNSPYQKLSKPVHRESLAQNNCEAHTTNKSSSDCCAAAPLLSLCSVALQGGRKVARRHDAAHSYPGEGYDGQREGWTGIAILGEHGEVFKAPPWPLDIKKDCGHLFLLSLSLLRMTQALAISCNTSARRSCSERRHPPSSPCCNLCTGLDHVASLNGGW